MKTLKSVSLRKAVLDYALRKYGTRPEYPWQRLPDYCVLRHAENRKWFAIVMNVRYEKFGIAKDGYTDILDIKVFPALSGSICRSRGFYSGYHMQKGGWITVLLDGTVDKKQICSLLDMSYEITAGVRKTGNRMRISRWLVPANPKFYDIEKAVSQSRDGTFLWKQSSHIQPGDIVYIYVAAPVSAVLYRCRAEEVNIPYAYADKNVRMSHVMKLKLLQQYDRRKFNLAFLKECGVAFIRGPRSIPDRLLNALEVPGEK
jgi:predicted DNA-binding protein (MmcQ/YjbR family)